MAACRIRNLFWFCTIVIFIANGPHVMSHTTLSGHSDKNLSQNRKSNTKRQHWQEISVEVFKDFYANGKYTGHLLDKAGREIPQAQVYLPGGDAPELQEHEATVPNDIEIMSRLWSALRVGNLPKNERVKIKSVPGYSYTDPLKEDLYVDQGSYLEIGTGITAYHLASQKNSLSTIAAVIIPDTHLPQLNKYSGEDKLLLHSLQLDELCEIVEDLQSDYQVMFGTILLSNLTAMVGDNLPHEYEEILAKIFSLAKYTLVSHSGTKDTNVKPFFKNWDSINDLMRRSCDIGGLECDVKLIPSSTSWQLEDDTSLSQVVLKSVQRKLPQHVCHEIEEGKECSLVYIQNNTDELTIQFDDDDDTFTLPPVRSHSITLRTLLKLGPTKSTREHLFTQLLQLPYSTQLSADTLHILGDRMLVSIPESDELYLDLDIEVQSLHEWIEETLQLDRSEVDDLKIYTDEEEETPQRQDKIGTLRFDTYDDFDMKSDQRKMSELSVDTKHNQGVKQMDTLDENPGHRRDSLGVKDQKMNGQAKEKKKFLDKFEMLEMIADPDDVLKQQNSQIDGVAHMWNRENIPRFDHEENDLQRLNEHWNRDDEQHKDGQNQLQELKGVEKMLVRDVDNDRGNEGEMKDTMDDELTNDEKDLKKAMNLLADDVRKDEAGEQKMGDEEEMKMQNNRYGDLGNLGVREQANKDANDEDMVNRDAIDGKMILLNEKGGQPQGQRIRRKKSKGKKKIVKEVGKDERLQQVDKEQKSEKTLTNVDEEIPKQLKIQEQKDFLPPDNNDDLINNQILDKEERNEKLAKEELRVKKDKFKDKFLGRHGNKDDVEKYEGNGDFRENKVQQRRLLGIEGDNEDNIDTNNPKFVQKLLDSCNSCTLRNDARGSNFGIQTDVPISPTFDGGNSKLSTFNTEAAAMTTTDNTDDEDDNAMSRIHDRKQRSEDHHKLELLYDREWKILKKYFNDPKVREDFSVFTYGGEQQSLTGIKVAKLYPNSTVITVIPRKQKHVMDKHRKLQESLRLNNNLVSSKQLSSEVVYRLHSLPEMFEFQVLGFSIFEQFASLGHSFPYYLGQLLSMAHITFLEVPSPAQLLLSDILLGNHTGVPNHGPAVYKGFVQDALKTANISDADVEIIEDRRSSHKSSLPLLKLLKIEIKAIKRKVVLDCSGSHGDMSVTSNGVHILSTSASNEHNTQTGLTRLGKAVGLEFILSLGLQNPERVTLFKSYLMLPQHRDMCPYNIVWYQDRLLYSHVMSPSSQLVQDQHIGQMEEKALSELITDQLDQEIPFSFMQYKATNDDLMLNLASKYKNSTFVSLLDEVAKAERVYEKVKNKKIPNMIVTALVDGIDEIFAAKLVESPEFLRYQFIDIHEFFELVEGLNSREKFNHMIGAVLSSGVSTFIQLPSAETLSLAYSIFFPTANNGWEDSGMSDDMKYMYENQPSPVHKNAETRLIRESAEITGNNRVTSKVLYPSYSPPSIDYSWNLLRVDITNLSIVVDHHFDYALDGHTRKYTLHCYSNDTDYRVFLIRNKDGFEIPYGAVHRISVIALLRMGILPEIRDDFYEMFVHMPLYEDMAPWNIVYKAGKLEYIDYDTKDFTLTKMVPAAYQIMSMLMNYERTVRDFGRCNSQSSNPYNFPFISNCVGSSYTGPCHDSRYPVPCGDQTCRSTYVECLQALSDLEKMKNNPQTRITASPFSDKDEETKDLEEVDGKTSWKLTQNKFTPSLW